MTIRYYTSLVVLAALAAITAGCSAPDLVWLAKTGATEQRQWTRYDTVEPDQRRAVNRALCRQEEIEKSEADGLRGKSGNRLFLVTTGSLFPERARRKGEVRTIGGKRYRLQFRYYVYQHMTTREDMLIDEVRYFRTLPETIMLFERIGPTSGDAPESPESPESPEAEPEPPE